ncbi:hypothetical protein FF38_02465 [Lucilia cuprina]|uniref:Uncharacterized protein n=1 Tax=Lucilia cuprina TaxID=7375 RepID=A0A0L0CAE9_LUCCU|nr:hypothetical protein FF38_02465 [Lucilia cuprina]
MKLFIAILVLCSLVICFSSPIDNKNLKSLLDADTSVHSDTDIKPISPDNSENIRAFNNDEHIRIARHHGYGGYGGGYGGYGGGYGGYGGYYDLVKICGPLNNRGGGLICGGYNGHARERPTTLLDVADAGDLYSNSADRFARHWGGGGWGGRGGWGGGGWGGRGGWGGGGWGGRGGWGGGGWGGRGGWGGGGWGGRGGWGGGGWG